MGIISQVFGRKPKGPPSVADAEQALERARQARDAAKARIAEADRRRAALLPVDGSDAEIEKVAADRGAAELSLERLSAIEPTLHAELVAARSKAKADKWDDIQSLTWPAADRFIAALKQSSSAWAEMQRLATEARSVGLVVEANGLFPAPAVQMAVVIDPSLAANLEKHFIRQRELGERTSKARSAEPQKALPAPAKPARVRIRFVDPGVQVEGGERPGRVGDEATVDPDQAQKWGRQGTAEIIGPVKRGME